MESSARTQVHTKAHTHTHTHAIPRVLIVTHGIRSLQFYVLEAPERSFFHFKAYPSIYKKTKTYFKGSLAAPYIPISVNKISHFVRRGVCWLEDRSSLA